MFAAVGAILAILGVALPLASPSAQAEEPAIASLTTSAGPILVTPEGDAAVVDPELTITGSAINEITGATITITDAQDGDLLDLDHELLGGLDGEYGQEHGVYTLTGAATAAEYQALLRTVTFKPGAEAGPRTITFEVNVELNPREAGFVNTGVDANGDSLSLGVEDSHWEVRYVEQRGTDVANPYPGIDQVADGIVPVIPTDEAGKPASAFWHTAWYPGTIEDLNVSPLGNAAWVGWDFTPYDPDDEDFTDFVHNAAANGPGGIYHYTLTVDLGDLAALAVSGEWWADDFAEDILLNGASTGQGVPEDCAEPEQPCTRYSTSVPFSFGGFQEGLNTITLVTSNFGGAKDLDYLGATGALVIFETASATASGQRTVNVRDITALQAAVTAAETPIEDDYTDASWTVFADALASANTVLDDADATQPEVDDATAALTAAQAALVEQATVDALTNLLASIDLIEAHYTSGSWDDLQDALTAANNAVDADPQVQADLTAALTDLQDAVAALVDITALQAAVDAAETPIEDDYTDASWTVFATALAAANTVLDDAEATQPEVDDAATALTAAQAALVEEEDDDDPVAASLHIAGDTTDLTTGADRSFIVTIRDADGHTVTAGVDSSLEITLVVGGDGSLTGGLTSTAANGVATFNLTGGDLGEVSVQATSEEPEFASNQLTFDVVAADPDPDPAPPVNDGGAPSIAGSAQVGQTLTADPGGWSGVPAPTFTYQWLRCDAGGNDCIEIDAATSGTYALTEDDLGATIKVRVTATNDEDAGDATSDRTEVVVEADPEPEGVTITTVALPGGTVGSRYTRSLVAAGGAEPYSWALVDGALPPGLSLNDETGVISGVPSADGTFNFTIEVTDSTPESDTQALSISISAAPEPNDDEGEDDREEETPQAPAQFDVIPPTSAGGVPGAQSGTSNNGRIRVNVPEGAVARPTVFTIIDILEVQDEVDAIPSGTFLFNGDYVGQVLAELDEDGQPITEFDVPIEVTFIIEPSHLEEFMDDDEYTVTYWNGDEWIALPTTVNRATGEVTALTRHLTLFALLRGQVEFTRPPFPTGVTLLALTRVGAEPEAIRLALQRHGCDPRGLWIFADGDATSYVVGGPAFVNARFPVALGVNTVLLVRCGTEEVTPPSPVTTPAPPAPAVVTVQPGDSLIGIARRNGVDWQTLGQLNGITTPPYVIHPGQVLELPERRELGRGPSS